MIEKRTWEEFIETGFIWWINMILHTFGWEITIELDEKGNVTDAYPSKVTRPWFEGENKSIRCIKVSPHTKENVDILLKIEEK